MPRYEYHEQNVEWKKPETKGDPTYVKYKNK